MQYQPGSDACEMTPDAEGDSLAVNPAGPRGGSAIVQTCREPEQLLKLAESRVHWKFD